MKRKIHLQVVTKSHWIGNLSLFRASLHDGAMRLRLASRTMTIDLIGASSLDMAWLLAFVADTLTVRFGRAVARDVTDFTA